MLVLYVTAKFSGFVNMTYKSCGNSVNRRLFELDEKELYLNIREELFLRRLESFSTQLLLLKLSSKDQDIDLIDDSYQEVQNLIQQIKFKNKRVSSEVTKKTTPAPTRKTTTTTQETENSQQEAMYSCGEYYNGSMYGYPRYKTGFVREKCKRPQLHESVTLILDRPRYSKTLVMSLKKITLLMYILMDEKSESDAFSKNLPSSVKIIYVSNRTNYIGMILNSILHKVVTPYVLITPFLGAFDKKTVDIERLVHVQEISKADIVGAASKDIDTGEWDRSCYQTMLKLYTLKYTKGYRVSKHECLRCNFVSSPFLSKKKFLVAIKFNSKLTHGIYEDFFLRINQSRHKILVCPDVMFYTYQPTVFDYQLNYFAKIRDIKKIVYSGGSVKWYGCRKGYSHTSRKKCTFQKGMAVPPCCLENLKDALNFVFDQCYKFNIACELQEGSVLGAVKFGGILPWERDADVSVLSKDFYSFQNLSFAFQKAGYEVVIHENTTCCTQDGRVKGGVLHIRAHGWSVQVFGQDDLHSLGVRTSIQTLKHWFLPENPGLYVRNRYGYSVYKHAEHWMTVNRKSGWEPYVGGEFSTCPKPGHHGCLDRWTADGDLPFFA